MQIEEREHVLIMEKRDVEVSYQGVIDNLRARYRAELEALGKGE
jgi:hypothetical protein